MKVNKLYRSTVLLAALCAAWGLSPEAHGAWGSIRANNRSGEEGGRGGHENRGGGHAEAARPAPNVGRDGEGRAEIRSWGNAERGRGTEGWTRGPEADWRERDHHLGIEEDRDRGYLWSHYHSGMFVPALPPGYVSIYVGGTPYYYDQGVYYEPESLGYAVVTPPPGAIVPALPPGAQAFYVGATVYYYAAGTFYVQQPNGFMVMPAPLGVTVSSLPPGAVPVTMNGILYYQANGAYYLPVMQGGVTAFTTVQP